MRIGLRWKILLITVLTPLSLGVAAVFTVQRNVRLHVDSSSLHENLQQSVRVFESMLAVRARAQAGGAEVVARDPRFFSLLTLGLRQRDSRFISTVRAMAREFNGITNTELFEVFDSRGRELASVGDARSDAAARTPLLRAALAGRPGTGVIVVDGTPYQTSVTPVRADGRVVGVLLLGSEIGPKLANLMRSQMMSDVTFLAQDDVLGTTLASEQDRAALTTRLRSLRASSEFDPRRLDLFEVEGSGHRWIAVARQLPGSTTASGQLYVMQRALDPEVEFLERMHHDLTTLAIVAVLAAVLTGLALSRALLRPVQQLVRAAHEMQSGNYESPLTARGRDELGYLVSRFGEMREREHAYVTSLEELTKLKTEFIRVASHELRSPISAIQGYSDLLASGAFGAVAPSQQQALDAIKGCLTKLTTIADEATRMAQVKGERIQLRLEPQPIGPLVERAAGLALAAAPGSPKVESAVAPGLRPFDVDGARLADAIAGVVGFAMRRAAADRAVRVSAGERDETLEIVVAHDGAALAPDEIEALFDRSFGAASADGDPSPVAALGIAREVVEAHGGTIEARNAAGGAVEVVIRVPRRRAVAGARAGGPARRAA